MKAIQVKYLPATNTKGARLKAFVDGFSITEPRNYSQDCDQQARDEAQGLIDQMGWDCKITGFGTLPNGDYVATIGE